MGNHSSYKIKDENKIKDESETMVSQSEEAPNSVCKLCWIFDLPVKHGDRDRLQIRQKEKKNPRFISYLSDRICILSMTKLKAY